MLVFIRMHSRIATVGFVFSAPKSMLFFLEATIQTTQLCFPCCCLAEVSMDSRKKDGQTFFFCFFHSFFFLLEICPGNICKESRCPVENGVQKRRNNGRVGAIASFTCPVNTIDIIEINVEIEPSHQNYNH